jgi:hypothetical protein
MTQKSDVERVFIAWREKQKSPALVRISEERRKLISRSLQDMSVEDLQALIRFAYEADHSRARWWRGENPRRRRYLGLEFLLQPTKLAPRVELALRWAAGDLEDDELEDHIGDGDEDEEESDGFVGMRRSSRTTRPTTGRTLGARRK